MKNTKELFLESQFWIMTIQAAFQRANVYKDNFDDNKRIVFRDYLHIEILNITKEYYSDVNEDKHLKNIVRLQEYSRNDEILQNGVLNFGICQKILNLYLKFIWCAGWIPTPPHFPIDRVIQERLGFKEIISWTKDLNSPNDYMIIINKAKGVLNNINIKKLAELELELYSNNNLKKLLRK